MSIDVPAYPMSSSSDGWLGCDGKDNFCITFDMDWAPDWAIRHCMDLCRAASVSATFFTTHQTDVLGELRSARDLFELGIHPNFLPGSTHGSDACSVFEQCLTWVPEAKATRSHGLVQSTALLSLIVDRFSQLETDVSISMPWHPGLYPVDFYYGGSRRRLTRIPYFWEDEDAGFFQNWDWQSFPRRPGLKMFNFHPIHVVLNSRSGDGYRRLKACLEGRPLWQAKEQEVDPLVNRDIGAKTFLTWLLDQSSASGAMTVSQISNRYRGHLR